MLRRLFAILFVGTAVGGISACSNYGTTDPSAELEEPRDYTRIDCTPPLYPASKDTHVRLPRVGVKSDPVILPDCRLTVFERQEVPAQQDGILLCIGTELKPDEPNPSSDRLFTIKQSLRHFEESKEKNKPRELTRRFRLLKEDDYVQRGQLMAILDDRLARDDFAIKTAKVSVSDKDHKAAEKTREEAHQRYLTQQRLFQNGATSVEELRGAELVWNKSTYEAQSKHEAYLQALHEQSQAETVLRMHEIRAGVSGFIKTIYKKQEESVRKYEAVFQIVNLHKLRAEGLLDSQFVRRVTVGMEAIVEPSESVPPDKTIGGHFYDITGLATGYCRDQPVIVSCDESKVRVWNRNGAEIRSFALPRNSAGKSVAC